MATVDELLERNPNLICDDTSLDTEKDALELEVIILRMSHQVIECRYMGTDYRIDREHVLELQGPQDLPSTGKMATLKLKGDSVLLAKYPTSARHLDSALPFTLARQQPVGPRGRTVPSPREIAWRQMTGYINPTIDAALPNDAGVAIFEEVIAQTGCDSVCGDIVDDSRTDD